MGEVEEKTIHDELAVTIQLADRVMKMAEEAESSKAECSEIARQVERLSQMLRSAARLATSTACLYERPVRRITADVMKNLDRTLILVRKCKHSGVLRQVFSMTTAADFRKVSALLESSIGDLKWLLTIFEPDDINLTLPPIANNDPTLAWVWSYIATIQMGQLRDRVEAANALVLLAHKNDRTKKIVVDEGGITPLLKLLKEGASPDAQIAAADALFHIGNDEERVRMIADAGVPIIVKFLGESVMRVQITVANLVARMAEMDDSVREAFARANVTRPLVSLLSMDTVLVVDDPKLKPGKPSISSLVQINKELTGKSFGHNSYNPSLSSVSSFTSSGGHSSLSVHSSSEGSSRGGHYRKEKEGETPELKMKLKVSCAEALWKLCKDSVTNSRKITETKGLICLAKIIEKEKGELQYNCLMAVMEIAMVAELDAELRRAAFKTSSPAAKAALDQLLRVIQEESSSTLKVPAIRSIGSLARTFPARETRIIGPLVEQLSNSDIEVAIEAAIALGKFVHPENFNRVEHAKAIIEFNGVPPLLKLLRTSERANIYGLILLSYLALHVGNSKALEQTQALSVLELAIRSGVPQDYKELFTKAIHNLNLYQAGVHTHRPSYPP